MDNYYMDNGGMQGMDMQGAVMQNEGMQGAGMQNPNFVASEADNEMSFADPNSFVPQNLRQFNPLGKYFSTRGRDVYGQETKFFFTQEERDYLSKYGVSAQEFYDKYQSKLGGEYVQGMPQSRGFAGPSFRDPSSFIPGYMRATCPEQGYSQFMYRDEIGLQKVAYLTPEEIEFTRVANMDISTYVNVYQKEFDYDKGQMEREGNSVTAAVSAQPQNLMEKTR